MNPINPQYGQVKYSPAVQYEVIEEPKPTKKYTNLFLMISIIYLILIFFFTLIIYSSLYGHQELYHRHHNALVAGVKGEFLKSESYSSSKCHIKNVNEVDAIRIYHQDEHIADFFFCYLILALCVFSFLIWILVFTSKGKVGGLNSKGAHAFIVFLFFLIIASTITYFIFFMSEGEDTIDHLERIDGNLDSLLNTKCYKLSVANEGYIETILHVIRPLVIVNFIISCIYFLIWAGLLGAASSKKSLCHPF